MKMTPDVKRRISKDWLSVFPGMSLYRPNWLMRRVDPLLIGILLDRDSSNECYRPSFHVHNLCHQSEVVFLNLHLRLAKEGQSPFSNGVDIAARWHETNWERAAARMKVLAALPLEGDLKLEEVISAYDSVMSASGMEGGSLTNYESLVALCSWCGDRPQAEKFVNAAIDHIKSWSKYQRENMVTYKKFDYEIWRQNIETLATSPEEVRRRVELSLERDHRLQKLPNSRLLG